MSKEQIKAARRKQAGNYAFLAPAAIIYLSVIVIPLIYSIYISFHKWNGVKAMEPVGIANYIRLFTEDDVFKTAFRNNLVWILLSVVVATALALAFALVLVKKFRGRTFFRGVFYFPCVVAPIAVAIIWRWMYNADFGFINSLMEALGIDYAQTWLSNPKTSLLALFAAALWQMVGEPMIFFPGRPAGGAQRAVRRGAGGRRHAGTEVLLRDASHDKRDIRHRDRHSRDQCCSCI